MSSYTPKIFKKGYFLLFFLFIYFLSGCNKAQQEKKARIDNHSLLTGQSKLKQIPKSSYPEFRKADSLLNELKLEAAVKEYSTAYKRLPPDSDLSKKQYGLFKMGFCLYGQYQFEKAKDIFKRGLEVFEKEGIKNHALLTDFNTYMGKNYGFLHEPDSALIYLKKAEQLELNRKVINYHKLGDLYNGFGSIYLYNLKDFIKSTNYVKKATNIFERLENVDKEYLLDSYYSLSTNYSMKKDYEKALNYTYKAITLAQSKKEMEKKWLPYIYDHIAIIHHSRKDYSKSIQYHQKAIGFIQKNDPKALFGFYYNKIGELYCQLKDFEKAKLSYHKALSISKKSGNKTEQADAYLGLAVAFPEVSATDSSRILFDKALKLKREVVGDNHPTFAFSYMIYGNLFKRSNQFDSALALYQKAFIYGIRDFHSSEIEENPTAKQVVMYHSYFNTVWNKASVFKMKYLISGKEEDLLNSLNCYDLLDSVLNIQKREYDDDYSEMMTNEGSKEIYDEAIGVCYLLYKMEGRQKYIEKALQYMEKAKGNLLWKNLKSIEANAKIGIPDSLVDKERSLKSKLAYYKSKLVDQEEKNQMDKEDLHHINDQVITISSKLELLKKKIATENPSYHNIKYASSPISIPEIVNYSKKTNSTFIHFFRGKEFIYTISIGKDSIFFKNSAISVAVDAHISEFQSSIKNDEALPLQENYSKIKESGFYLYSRLLKPVLQDFPLAGKRESNLIIIPDENLCSIPFEALITTKSTGEQIDFKSLPYLIRKFNIKYTYSLNIYFQPKADKSENKRSLIGFDYYIYDSSGLVKDYSTQLKGSAKELKFIKAAMNRGEFFQGEKATEENFKRNAPSADIIHLAVHGIADTINPLNSRLYFNQSSSKKEDGLLFFHELYDLQTDASLVVLSACQTAVGRNQVGEGVMSLGRAFQYAGASGLIMSLWKINDISSAALIGSFYSALSQEMEISNSLTRAKLEFIEGSDEITAHPKNWAGLVFYGNFEDSIKQEVNPFRYFFLGFSFFILLILLFLYYRKRQGKPVF